MTIDKSSDVTQAPVMPKKKVNKVHYFMCRNSRSLHLLSATKKFHYKFKKGTPLPVTIPEDVALFKMKVDALYECTMNGTPLNNYGSLAMGNVGAKPLSYRKFNAGAVKNQEVDPFLKAQTLQESKLNGVGTALDGQKKVSIQRVTVSEKEDDLPAFDQSPLPIENNNKVNPGSPINAPALRVEKDTLEALEEEEKAKAELEAAKESIRNKKKKMAGRKSHNLNNSK